MRRTRREIRDQGAVPWRSSRRAVIACAASATRAAARAPSRTTPSTRRAPSLPAGSPEQRRGQRDPERRALARPPRRASAASAALPAALPRHPRRGLEGRRASPGRWGTAPTGWMAKARANHAFQGGRRSRAQRGQRGGAC